MASGVNLWLDGVTAGCKPALPEKFLAASALEQVGHSNSLRGLTCVGKVWVENLYYRKSVLAIGVLWRRRFSNSLKS